MAVRREVGEPLAAAAEDMTEDVSKGINRSCVWYSKWYLNVGNAHEDWRKIWEWWLVQGEKMESRDWSRYTTKFAARALLHCMQ